MGLEFSGLKNIRQVHPGIDFELDEDEFEPVDFSRNITQLRHASGFADRAPEIIDGAWYEYDDCWAPDGQIGYSNYSQWRSELADLSGYTGSETDPFHELLQFSDCEGTIGAAAAGRLLKAFVHFEHKARIFQSTSFYRRYTWFHQVIEFAAQNGAVVFH
ncbi:hypothetical protein ELI15_14085 [Rhizobium ruizarguesonis]|uniref:hypothetical protein n=1 Tax=Rhizobium ruizarguesonis TaxID=2081791 RepID=UPI0010300B9F|nr:hypothetical protein [Rhizobium ruizarguesonis]TAW65419.1 hypothetical protein ELI15_14085 [Rhizobium ruizarguesonis]